MNKPLILVVEDDTSIRNLITTTLKTNDYRHVVAMNGKMALMEATSHRPDIASLRVFMATLRKKLEPTKDSPQYIQTHIGVGYRMIRVE